MDKTIGDIASELHRKPHQVTYAIASRGIRETRRIGIIRLFDDAAVDQIKVAVAEIDAKSTGE